jgi:hypothetical protein
MVFTCNTVGYDGICASGYRHVSAEFPALTDRFDTFEHPKKVLDAPVAGLFVFSLITGISLLPDLSIVCFCTALFLFHHCKFGAVALTYFYLF